MQLEEEILVPDKKPVDFTTLPDGDYVVVITNFESRTVNGSKMSGTVFDVIIQVIEGSFTGHEVKEFCPLKANDAKHRQWGQRVIAKLAWACGLAGKQLKDTSQLYGIPFVVNISRYEEIYPDKETGEEKTASKNKIEDYKIYKKWITARTDDNATSGNTNYQSVVAKAQTETKPEQTSYADARKKRTEMKPRLFKITDINDERLKDYGYEPEFERFNLYLDEKKQWWIENVNIPGVLTLYDAEKILETKAAIDFDIV
jgi:hypothetical protein